MVSHLFVVAREHGLIDMLLLERFSEESEIRKGKRNSEDSQISYDIVN